MKHTLYLVSCLLTPLPILAQLTWKNVDSLYQPLPPSVHVYFSNDSLEGKPNIAYYLEANLKDRKLIFSAEGQNGKRFTPTEYYNNLDKPLAVVNCTFFEFARNSNLNIVMKNGKILSYNQQTIAGRGKDTLTYYHVTPSAIGINKKRKADVAWVFTDSTFKWPVAFQHSPVLKQNVVSRSNFNLYAPSLWHSSVAKKTLGIEKWKMQTAVGGGPVLMQNGSIRITNNEERKFGGKAINDKHPRTTMGYTKDGRLIILMFEGRFPGKAEGATLEQEAMVLQSLGCWEALNLDGGGSSCLLINGKETIKPSDAGGQRPVPAVFVIKLKD